MTHYNPLDSQNRILPYRWTWTQSISEPMLSLSYDYDVLSLGLLKNQATSMEVSLKELHAGCLAELNASCQNIAIAKALMSITRKVSSNKPSNEGSGVVCFRAMHEFSFGIGGGFKYQCCKEGERTNEKTFDCGLNVIESNWLAVFNAILAVVIAVVFLYWPLILYAIPDSFFEADSDGSCQTGQVQTHKSLISKNDHETQTRGEGTFNNREKSFEHIPVDDLSPVTCAMIARQCAENLPNLSHAFNVKLFFLWYCIVPIFFYIKVGLYFIIKRNHFDDASRKLLFQFGDFYLNVFSVDRPLVYVLFIFPLFIIPGVVLSCWNPQSGTSDQTTASECCLCHEKCITPQKEIKEHVKAMPQFISNELWRELKDFLITKSKILRKGNFHSRHSSCGHAICVLCSVAATLIIVPVVAIIIFLIVFFASILCMIVYSPYICLMMITFRFIHKRPVYKGLLFVTLVYSSLSVCIVAIFSCQFIVRMFGFIVMGLTLNAEVTVPYVTFVFVVWRNIYLCYSNLQTRYKEIKEMISEQLKDLTKKSNNGDKITTDLTKNSDKITTDLTNNSDTIPKDLTDNSDSIPKDLFWYVCDDHKVLPRANEFCRILWNIVAILIFLLIALSAIFLFKVAYNSSAIVSTIAVFVSGKMSEVFFSRVTTGYSFIGWKKLRTKDKIRSAIKEYLREKGNASTTKRQGVEESDSSNVQYETTVV